jgi:hypothetical protein
LFFVLFWGLFPFKLKLMVKGEVRDENVNRGRGRLKMSKGAFDYVGTDIKKGLGKEQIATT